MQCLVPCCAMCNCPRRRCQLIMASGLQQYPDQVKRTVLMLMQRPRPNLSLWAADGVRHPCLAHVAAGSPAAKSCQQVMPAHSAMCRDTQSNYGIFPFYSELRNENVRIPSSQLLESFSHTTASPAWSRYKQHWAHCVNSSGTPTGMHVGMCIAWCCLPSYSTELASSMVSEAEKQQQEYMVQQEPCLVLTAHINFPSSRTGIWHSFSWPTAHSTCTHNCNSAYPKLQVVNGHPPP